MSAPRLRVAVESFPVRGVFRISRGARTEARVVVATIAVDGVEGRGECVPYPRYGETVEGVVADIQAQAPDVAAGLDREGLRRAMPAGAARNALDCALWDAEAKRRRTPVWRLAGLPRPRPLLSAFTIGVDSPHAMAAMAAAHGNKPVLKLKMAAGDDDLERVRAVRAARPDVRLIVDANEAWSPAETARLLPALAALGVALVEQPLPAADDAALTDMPRPVPVCADESSHVADDVPRLVGRYDMVNIKLDKAGGLTEALAVQRAARAAGLGVMVGCMVGTSLAMAPAMLLAQEADVVDLDGPLLLARDRADGLRYDGARMHPPTPALWG